MYFIWLQADLEVEFSIPSLEKAETYDDKWVDAQEACANKGSNVEGGVGPFGILTLASEKLEEFTPVFFRIFKDKKKHVILMCSDARRLVWLNLGKEHSFSVDLETNCLFWADRL